MDTQTESDDYEVGSTMSQFPYQIPFQLHTNSIGAYREVHLSIGLDTRLEVTPPQKKTAFFGRHLWPHVEFDRQMYLPILPIQCHMK